MANVVAPSISALLILDGDGKRIAVKYYGREMSELKTQLSFEKKIWSKTARTNARVDDANENELIILSVLNALEETLGNLLRNQVSKKTLVDNLDLLLLTIDEIIDDGIILETDASQITNRVAMRGSDKEVPLSEQSFSQALQTARDQLVRSFR